MRFPWSASEAPVGIPVHRASTMVLFLAGMFAGGAIDHLILAMKREVNTPYGLRVGVMGNGLLALLDAAAAVAACAAHRRTRRAGYRSSG
jgi:hypothetical protein